MLQNRSGVFNIRFWFVRFWLLSLRAGWRRGEIPRLRFAPRGMTENGLS